MAKATVPEKQSPSVWFPNWLSEECSFVRSF